MMLVWVVLIVSLVALYAIFNQKIKSLNSKVNKLNQQVQQLNQLISTVPPSANNQSDSTLNPISSIVNKPISTTDVEVPTGKSQPQAAKQRVELDEIDTRDHPKPSIADANSVLQPTAGQERSADQNRFIEPDEQSLPVVTSLFHSFKHWFLGGNLVVRVGAIVLLIGVVLLLRLLSDYFETPIEVKLLVVGLIGLTVSALGLKLVKKRFAYGITLQGVGLSAAYLTTFFAYQVYNVLPSLPSFVLLGGLSAITVILAVRQNAFPLALLALSGAFLAPLLTSSDTGSLTTLFSYYLVLNIAIAVIAHYRTWKALNLLGATITFGLAYYWGFSDPIGTSTAPLFAQRWPLVSIVSLHWLLYVFIAVRYAQQVIDYNHNLSQTIASNASAASQPPLASPPLKQAMLYPIDTGLMFATPLLVFGLLSALLHDVAHALTLAGMLMSATYLGVGWILAKRSRHYALLTEGMLALGFGFVVVVIALELQMTWVPIGWSAQGLALVWFGRRSLRAWSVAFGLALQSFAIFSLIQQIDDSSIDVSHLALSFSAIACLASLFVLRYANKPSPSNSSRDKELLPLINSGSLLFKTVWQSPFFIGLLTLSGMIWAFVVAAILFKEHLIAIFSNSALRLGTICLLFSILYLAIDHYRSWREANFINHSVLALFYGILLSIYPISGALRYPASPLNWTLFILLIIGWMVIGQLWLRRWSKTPNILKNDSVNKSNTRVSLAQHHQTASKVDSALWLITGILLISQLANRFLPTAEGVFLTLLPTLALLGLIYISLKNMSGENKPLPPPWFNWQTALLSSATLFVPLAIGWVLFGNWFVDGLGWDLGLPYLPVLNLFDLSIITLLMYLVGIATLHNQYHQTYSTAPFDQPRTGKSSLLLKMAGILGFYVLSSMLVRTLHAYAGTPIWDRGAWNNAQVQTGLTILWTLTALVATFMSSRNGKRFWWIMGIGLMGVVVLKLVLIDLSHTNAIWRVVSFIGAGSLILLIGYLAPLPPEQNKEVD